MAEDVAEVALLSVREAIIVVANIVRVRRPVKKFYFKVIVQLKL